MEKTYGMMVAASVIEEVKKAVIGKQDCIKKVMAAILAGGHILIEDIPGVGKTTMAVAFSKSMGLLRHRVQFTPDVLPADIVGFSLYDKKTQQFVYQPGAAMCNLLLADEINRTSPKTQSALLEVMEERQVTVDQRTYEVPEPFIVIATENPFGSAGTQMLPESQLDRFMICISSQRSRSLREIRKVVRRMRSALSWTRTFCLQCKKRWRRFIFTMQSTNILEILWRRPEITRWYGLASAQEGRLLLLKQQKLMPIWREERFASRMMWRVSSRM